MIDTIAPLSDAHLEALQAVPLDNLIWKFRLNEVTIGHGCDAVTFLECCYLTTSPEPVKWVEVDPLQGLQNLIADIMKGL
jgi:hypothetical protein